MCASTLSAALTSFKGSITAPGSNPTATFIAPAVSATRRRLSELSRSESPAVEQRHQHVGKGRSSDQSGDFCRRWLECLHAEKGTLQICDPIP
jgi:hypothetical protein